MRMSKARNLAVEKLMVKAEVECGEVDNPLFGLRKIDHYHKLASKQNQIYRHGRRNYMYSK